MLLAVVACGFFPLFQLKTAGVPAEAAGAGVAGSIGLGMLFFYLMLPVVGTMIMARTANLFYNGTALGPVGFRSSQRARSRVWIYLGNRILIALTLSLFIPWAKFAAGAARHRRRGHPGGRHRRRRLRHRPGRRPARQPSRHAGTDRAVPGRRRLSLSHHPGMLE